MKKTGILILAMLALFTAACDPQNGGLTNQEGGTLTGALVGGAIGHEVGNGNIGVTIAGALIGGMIGNEIGKYIDEEDQRIALEAEERALERAKDGTPVAWRNPDNGHQGKVIPSKTYTKDGNKCRKYSHSIKTKESTKGYEREACKQSDGKWVATSLTPMPEVKAS